MTKFLRNGENAMAMRRLDKFARHSGGSMNGIHVATSRTKSTVTTKRNKVKMITFMATVHSTAVRRVTTFKHPINIVNDRVTRMQSI